VSTTYLFRYLNGAGGVIRMHLKQCIDDAEALKLAAGALLEYERLEIRRGDTIIWAGPRGQFAAAA
jgi:hypothetical protein